MSKKYPKQKRKDYLAQNKHLDPKLHRTKYFGTLDEAKTWLSEQGGGTIKKRNAEVIHSSGYGLERVDFVPPLRVWGEVYDSEKDAK
jgi:hypothetical protein